ncbi:MAG: AMP-binding protein [Myxococcales bacterium]|nr:AMP-binding protein [Myxococcales bacterium]
MSTFSLSRAQLLPWRAPMPVTTVTARGTVGQRRGWWLEVTTTHGLVARGEAAPLPQFGGETRAACRAALADWVSRNSTSRWPTEAAALTDAIDRCGLPPVARAAVSQALWALASRIRGLGVAELLSELTATPPALRVPQSHRLVFHADDALAAVADGAKTLKVKVGLAPAADLSRLSAIAAAVGPDISLHIDANGGWSRQDVTSVWPRLRELGVRLIEEPAELTTDAAWLAGLVQTGGPAVFADESCRTLQALTSLPESVAGVVLKPMLNGGVDKAAELAAAASRLGLSVMVTTTFGTQLDRDAAIAVARVSPTLVACGLDPLRSVVRPDSRPATGAVPHPVRAASRQRPAHPALITASGQLTWRQVADEAARRAAVLQRAGVQEGDRVALPCWTGTDTCLWIHAITWLGATVAPLDGKARGAALRGRLAAIGPDFLLDCGNPAAPSASTSWPLGDLDCVVIGTSDLSDPAGKRHGRHDQPTPSLASVPWSMDTVVARLCTSGSTGQPRAVDLTANQLMASTFGSTQRLGHLPDDVWLCALPLHHTGGLSVLLRTAWLATTARLMTPFDADAAVRALTAGTLTQASLVPTWLRQIVNTWPTDASVHPSVRVLLVGGDRLPDALRSAAVAIGLPLAETWGMTEAASQVATRAPWDAPATGPGTPVCTAEVSEDEHGRLVVHGPVVAGGSLTSGDRGQVAKTGEVSVSGRADAGFQCGGELVDPVQLEAILNMHPAIVDAAVVAMPDPRLGHRPAAMVKLSQSDSAPSASELISWAEGQLRRFLVPAPLVVTAALPRTGLGKIDRAAVMHALSALRDVGREQGRQGGAHVVGQGPGLAGTFVHAGVHVAHNDAQLGGVQLEAKAHRAPAKSGDVALNANPLPETHRPFVVGLDVDQGQHPVAGSEDLSQRQADVLEQGLEGAVGVLERTTEKGNARRVDLGESDTMKMGHEASPSSGTSRCSEEVRR